MFGKKKDDMDNFVDYAVPAIMCKSCNVFSNKTISC